MDTLTRSLSFFETIRRLDANERSERVPPAPFANFNTLAHSPVITCPYENEFISVGEKPEYLAELKNFFPQLKSSIK